MFTYWIVICLAAVALVHWSGTNVDAQEKINKVEKELVRALEDAIKIQGKSCEEECGDIDEDSTIKQVMICVSCECDEDPSLDICGDDKRQAQNNQPGDMLQKVYSAKRWSSGLPRNTKIPYSYRFKRN